MGGGWCESPSDCAGRAKSYIGSSDPQYFKQEPGDSIPGLSDYNETMDFAYIPSCLGSRWCGGLMANDTIENPLTATWNKVLLPYWCEIAVARTGASLVLARHANLVNVIAFLSLLDMYIHAPTLGKQILPPRLASKFY